MLSVMPKIRSLDPNLADAAMDLGATPWRALTKVIVPQIMPGIAFRCADRIYDVSR